MTTDADYVAVDLTSLCNAGLEVLEGLRQPPVGELAFHGIPFVIGGEEANDCFIRLDPGSGPVVVPLSARAERVIIAHRRIAGNGRVYVGDQVAAYRFRLSDGSVHEAPIRERLEIGMIPQEGWDASGPFLAAGTNSWELVDRYEGRWQDIGQRQCETVYKSMSDYILWVWENPHPDTSVEQIEFEATSAPVLVAGITLSAAGESPFSREAARTLVISKAAPDGASAPFEDPVVTVDRGTASYAFRLPDRDLDGYLADPYKGWGEPADPDANSAYVRVSATPSATVQVSDGEEILGSFRWDELDYETPVERDKIRVSIAETGRNWVKVTVVDDETEEPVPCRVHFSSPEGVPYQPHGHHNHVNSDLDTWHIDVGGDLKLGRKTYAYIDGTCEGWLPRGDVYVDVARGFEYEPIREKIQVDRGLTELTLRLGRWTSMNDKGWYSGDSHVHFLSGQGALTEQQGEDLNVVNLLQSQWGSLFTNTEDFTGTLLKGPGGQNVTWVGQENRQPFFGHMLLWGLERPVMPWCTDGPNEADGGAWQEVTMSDWADRCHDQGGTVIIPHFPLPNGEPAVLIATGRTDAVEMIVQRESFHDEYYAYLNCGYQVPLVGGTDKMSADVPVGIYRTYARLGDEEFGYDAWCRAVRAGRTILSGGPLIDFRVDGAEAGDTVRINGSGTVSVSTVAESIFPFNTLQVVCNGVVVAEAVDDNGTRRLAVDAEVPIEGDGWLAARCGGAGYWNSKSHLGPWERGVFAHTSPVYVATGPGDWSRFDQNQARRMVTMIEGGLQRIRSSRQYPLDRITHHHGEQDHMAYLERPFLEALELVQARLEQ
jgi:hypothetical protein